MYLTVAQKQEIRTLYATGYHTQTELAARFGVTQESISKTVRSTPRACVDCGVPLAYAQRCAACKVVRNASCQLNYRQHNREKINQRSSRLWAEDERYREMHRRIARESARRRYVRKRG